MSNLPNVAGVTVSEKEVFVICGFSSEIKVFNCETFTHLRNISTAEVRNPSDITFSENILFVGETTQKLIHRIPLNSIESTSSWAVDSWGISLSNYAFIKYSCDMPCNIETRGIHNCRSTRERDYSATRNEISNSCHSVGPR